MQHKKIIFLTSIVWMLILGLMFFLYPHKHVDTNLVMVDVQGITDHFIHDQASKNYDEATLRRHVKAFSQRLDRSLNRLAAQNKVIIVPREAVLAGGKDLTGLIVEQLQSDSDNDNG